MSSLISVLYIDFSFDPPGRRARKRDILERNSSNINRSDEDGRRQSWCIASAVQCCAAAAGPWRQADWFVVKGGSNVRALLGAALKGPCRPAAASMTGKSCASSDFRSRLTGRLYGGATCVGPPAFYGAASFVNRDSAKPYRPKSPYRRKSPRLVARASAGLAFEAFAASRALFARGDAVARTGIGIAVEASVGASARAFRISEPLGREGRAADERAKRDNQSSQDHVCKIIPGASFNSSARQRRDAALRPCHRPSGIPRSS